jgi:hypothetical protein
MTPHKVGTMPANSERLHGERLKDEVYRQMFRLESHRPGAERDLAVALLRACVASDATPKVGVDRPWLKKICPICLAMIEAAVQSGDTSSPCIQ